MSHDARVQVWPDRLTAACRRQEALDEMERKKERILMMSLKRKQQQEAARVRKEEQAQRRREDDSRKEEEKQRKKEEERLRKERIFEQYKLKKAIEEAEKNGVRLLAPPDGHRALSVGPGVSLGMVNSSH